MDRIRTLEDDVGFAHVSGTGKRKKEAINRLRKSRKQGKIPYPFPNGWYALAESREVSYVNEWLCEVSPFFGCYTCMDGPLKWQSAPHERRVGFAKAVIIFVLFQIKMGEIKHVSALGQNFAVFRGEESNQIHVLDAYCSHLGADLTAGGNSNE